MENKKNINSFYQLIHNAMDYFLLKIHEIYLKFISLLKPVHPMHMHSDLFKFSDYIPALAILLALFSMTDIRYRFRVSITPLIPIDRLAYSLFIIVGFLSLSSGYFYGKMNSESQIISIFSNFLVIQMLLGLFFFIPVALWIYFSFIKPPIFGKGNWNRYFKNISSIILRGTENDLTVISNEVGISSKNIIKHAHKFSKIVSDKDSNSVGIVSHRLLLFFGYKRFCQYVVSSSPITAISIFSEITRQKAYKLPINQFALNIFSEALLNENSILYHEDNLYKSGFIGHYKPFISSLFSDYYLLESLAETGLTPFDISYEIISKWNSKQVKAFCICLVIFFKSYLVELTKKGDIHSFAFTRGINIISDNLSTRINSNCNQSDLLDLQSNLRARVECISELIKLINNTEKLPNCSFRNKSRKMDFYDIIAGAMFNIIFEASLVKEDASLCWSVQHNIVFDNFFSHIIPGNKIIFHRLRRKIFNSIKYLEECPNYKDVKILGFCLNTMGLTLSDKKNRENDYALHKVILNWAKNNYLKIVNFNQEIANDCLMGRMSFEKENKRLLKSFIKNLQGDTPKEYLDLIDC